MKAAVIDTETNALEGYDKCWVTVCRDAETNEVTVFRNLHEERNADLLSKHLSNYACCVGHNLLGFDLSVFNRFGIRLRVGTSFVDTLVVGRLLNYSQDGGHSLENYGEKQGIPKSKFNDFSRWSQELEDRCIVDTEITRNLFVHKFGKYLADEAWAPAIDLEHKTAELCQSLHKNGFGFDIDKAQALREEIAGKVNLLLEQFAIDFPPKPVLIREISPTRTKHGTLHSKDFRWLGDTTRDLSHFSADAPFSLFDYLPFNPSSPRQVVERLNAAGWQPTEKTKGHIKAEREGDAEALKEQRIYGWRVCEENLQTLPPDAPQSAQRLAEYLLLSSRLGDLEEWIQLYDPRTKSIHGSFSGIGSWTHRKAHQRPNMANIPALVDRKGRPQPYGADFRATFLAREGRVLVGCDAEGIQLRVFAHYCNDPRLIEAIVNGKSELGTDIHTINKGVLGDICSSRPVAKTYIYALLLGAGKAKQAGILSCTAKEAADGLNRILKYYPGWGELKKTVIPKDGERGYFVGLDGRKVIHPGEHYVLAGYLQNGESVIMKRACLLWHDVLQRMKIPFTFVNDVHDEWQTETLPEYAEIIGKVQADSIRIIGEQLKLNCPLAGKFSIGLNWKETH